MTDKVMECITNPVKCKLLLEIHAQGQTTAKHLSDALEDIPQATLYRNLKKMLNDGILKVVEETQVRGTLEKTYALACNLTEDFETILNNNSGTLYMQAFMQYFLGFAKQFRAYCQTPDINIKEDMSGFSLSHLYLSDDELTELIKAISALIGAAEKNTPKEGRKLRTIGVVVSPPGDPK